MAIVMMDNGEPSAFLTLHYVDSTNLENRIPRRESELYLQSYVTLCRLNIGN